MDINQLNNLQSYMFREGSIHSAVKVVKTLINAYSKNADKDNFFDSKLKKALTDFQQSKSLQPTGILNLKTWLAIGAEMDPITINIVSMSDPMLRDLLLSGYRSKFPFKKFSSNNSFATPIHISSTSSIFETKSYEFTFRLFVSVFAPFDWFGPLNLSRGDSASRRFTFDPKASYRLQSFSTITATPGTRTYQWTKNYAKTNVSPATDSYLWMPWNRGSSSVKSKGQIRREELTTDFDNPFSEETNHTPHHLKYHLSGNDDAFAIVGENSWLSSDIDVHPNIQFKYTQDKTDSNKIRLRAFGNVIGDQFPCVETFLNDKNDNGVMLGIWQIREGDGPVTTREGTPGIPGDKRLPMIDFDITIIVEKGIFTGVEKNGRVVSLAEHNKPYIDAAPVTGTPLPLEKPRPATHY